MKVCWKERVVGPSLKRIFLTTLLLGCLAAPVILYYDLHRQAVLSAKPGGSDAQANAVNADKLLSLRCDSMQDKSAVKAMCSSGSFDCKLPHIALLHNLEQQ